MWKLLLCLVFAVSAVAGPWKEYQCKLPTDSYMDGDSFKGTATTGYTYIWRLYGIDCPETDDRQPDRVKAQAKHFGIDEKEVLKWGEKAAKFTKKTLAKGFTVHTKKEKARGASDKQRYYAIVLVGEKNLAEMLVEEGYARAFGMPVYSPLGRGVDKEQFMRLLERAERKAKREKKGIWAAGG